MAAIDLFSVILITTSSKSVVLIYKHIFSGTTISYILLLTFYDIHIRHGYIWRTPILIILYLINYATWRGNSEVAYSFCLNVFTTHQAYVFSPILTDTSKSVYFEDNGLRVWEFVSVLHTWQPILSNGLHDTSNNEYLKGKKRQRFRGVHLIELI